MRLPGQTPLGSQRQGDRKDDLDHSISSLPNQHHHDHQYGNHYSHDYDYIREQNFSPISSASAESSRDNPLQIDLPEEDGVGDDDDEEEEEEEEEEVDGEGMEDEEEDEARSSELGETNSSGGGDGGGATTGALEDSAEAKANGKKKPGRKKGQMSKVLHLWEFILNLLKDPEHCPRIIHWENKEEGVFRVLQSSEVARLWGEKKRNKKVMTYEKLSRSLRYSRKEGFFDALPKGHSYPKKLCFKFGPRSHGWRDKLNNNSS